MTEIVEKPEPPDAAKRRFPIVPIVIFVLLIAGLGILFLSRSKPEEAVRRLVDRQVKLTVSGNAQALYRTFGPRVRQVCPLRTFEGAFQSAGDFMSLIEYKDIKVKVEGDRALVTYVVTYNGRPIKEITPDNPDVYVQVTETVLGQPFDPTAALQALEQERTQGLITDPKAYEERKKAYERRAGQRPRIFTAGQWYDDLDEYVDCSGS
jgi:hypothetical protein